MLSNCIPSPFLWGWPLTPVAYLVPDTGVLQLPVGRRLQKGEAVPCSMMGGLRRPWQGEPQPKSYHRDLARRAHSVRQAAIQVTGTAPTCGSGDVASLCPGVRGHGRGRGCSAEEGRTRDRSLEACSHGPAVPLICSDSSGRSPPLGSQFPHLGDAGPGGVAQIPFE